MSSQNIPKYLQEEEALSEESKALISSLPRQKGWFNSSHIYLYQGFWYQPNHLQAVISCQKHFQVEDSDVFLVTYPKCGTTWLKAVIFTLLNRKQYPVVAKNHPLLTTNPHDLVLSLEINLYADNQIPSSAASFPSRRFFSTHMPYVSLPKNSSSSKSKCKVVYVCRNPKDTFVSLWHFMNKLQLQEDGSIREKFEMFCDGGVGYGPFWDHVLEYWKQSREMNSDRVLFLKYEDMKEKAEVELRRLAEFLECPFSVEEEESGVVEGILKLTSFESMSSLEVNKVGRLMNGMENRHFFREGVVGDWNNYLSAQMVHKLDQITREKFLGWGLVL